MIAHDSPSLFEALPGLSGQPSRQHRGRVASSREGTYGLRDGRYATIAFLGKRMYLRPPQDEADKRPAPINLQPWRRRRQRDDQAARALPPTLMVPPQRRKRSSTRVSMAR